MVEGIAPPQIKDHDMNIRLDVLENTSKIDFYSCSVVKSEYKYEHVESGL